MLFDLADAIAVRRMVVFIDAILGDWIEIPNDHFAAALMCLQMMSNLKSRG